MTFKAISSQKYAALCFGIAIILAIAGIGVFSSLTERPISGNLFWRGLFVVSCLGGGIYFFYLAYAYWQLSYHLDRNGLQIRWGGILSRWSQQQIINIVPVTQASLPEKRFLKLPLPTWWVGTWGNTHYYATVPITAALLVQTQQQQLILSPNDSQAFIQAWQRRKPLGATQNWSEPHVRWWILGWPFWRDRRAWMLGGGAILLALGLLGWLSTRYATAGVLQPTLQHLATASGIILLFNLLLGGIWYPKTPLAAYILWAFAGIAQLGLAVAVRTISG